MKEIPINLKKIRRCFLFQTLPREAQGIYFTALFAMWSERFEQTTNFPDFISVYVEGEGDEDIQNNFVYWLIGDEDPDDFTYVLDSVLDLWECGIIKTDGNFVLLTLRDILF